MFTMDVADQNCIPGQVILFTTGKSHDVPRFLARAVRPFNVAEAFRQFRDSEGALPKWESFLTWMLRSGYIEAVEHTEVHMTASWADGDSVDMQPISTQEDIIEMANGKACPKCASHHVVPEMKRGHADMARRVCTDCGHHFSVAA
ncbi:hypothetical protein [Emcibacter sp. SYSU 3D8]|uniref:hypothetical protein n=1 Tax=Emcibacter sp. SYSU 3D8 TaxID=3133969 RepID=UPI0031FE5227